MHTKISEFAVPKNNNDTRGGDNTVNFIGRK